MASASRIEYSEKYNDDQYEYRHVILPKERAKNIPRNTLMGEAEWRRLGVQQSRGWEHYAVHRPEPHILLFRRPHGTNPVTGCVEPELERAARLSYYRRRVGAPTTGRQQQLVQGKMKRGRMKRRSKMAQQRKKDLDEQ